MDDDRVEVVCARPGCGKEFLALRRRRGPRAGYCSRRCSNSDWVRIHRERERAKRIERVTERRARELEEARLERERKRRPRPRVDPSKLAGFAESVGLTPRLFSPKFNPAQEQFFCDISPLCLYSGAFGAGKTHILCLKALGVSLMYPRNFILLCRKEFSSMRQTTIRKFLQLAEPYMDLKTGYNKSEQLVTLLDEFGRSQILFSGLDDPQRIASLEVAWIGIDESIELEESDWIMLNGRVRHRAMPFRQIAAASNPCIPGSYQHRMFFDRGEGAVYHSTALDNKFNPPDFADRLGMFKGIYYDRYVMGKCVGAEGLVYDCYEPSVHVIEPFAIPADWPRYRSVDFGYAEAMVVLWAARQPHPPTEHFPYPEGTLFVYRELYHRHQLVEDAARRILAESKTICEGESFPERVVCTFADHDAEGRATLNAHGVGTIAAIKNVATGIQTVYRRLADAVAWDKYRKAHPDDDARGIRDGKALALKPVFFFRNLGLDKDPSLVSGNLPTGLLEEFGSYVWEPAGEGRSAKEVPRKKSDHGMDALRYLVMGVERGQERPVVFL